MATIEDAINAHIRYCEKQKHPSQNPLINRDMDIWIKVLKSAPRDVMDLQKVNWGGAIKPSDPASSTELAPLNF